MRQLRGDFASLVAGEAFGLSMTPNAYFGYSDENPESYIRTVTWK